MHIAFAEVCAKNGKVEEALAVIESGLTLPQRLASAELHRVRGELLLLKAPPDKVGAEASLREAIGIARSQAARLYELRAATSLARLLRDTNRRDEAHTILADIYDWFTEGFDTADLKDAKALLDELSE